MKKFGVKFYNHKPDPKFLRFKNYKPVLKAINAVFNIINSLFDVKFIKSLFNCEWHAKSPCLS